MTQDIPPAPRPPPPKGWFRTGGLACELARIHLKQDRLILMGMAATILASFPFALAVTPKWIEVRQTLGATWLFWVIVGLPGFALLFGGAAGAQLAGESSRAAETLLPVAAPRRAWAYVSSASIETTALALLILALGVIGTHDNGIELKAPFRIFSWWWPDVMLPFALSFIGTLPYMLLVSLMAAYASGSGVLGGLVGGLVGALCLWGLEAGFALRAIHQGRVYYAGWALAGGVLAVAGSALALNETARRLERRERTSWATMARIALTVVLGMLVASGAAVWKYRWVAGATRILQASGYPPTTETRAQEARDGVVLQTVAGDIYWATPDGRRKFLWGGPGHGRFDPRPARAEIEWEGLRLWLLVRPDARYGLLELWSGEPDSGLRLVSRFATPHSVYLTKKGRGVILWSFEGWAPVSSGMRQPEWRAPSTSLLLSEPRAPTTALAIPSGGGSWRYSNAKRELRWTTPAGKKLGPVGLPAQEEVRAVVRSAGDRAWVLTDSKLLVVDGEAKGKVESFALPRLRPVRLGYEPWHSTQVGTEGLFLHTGTSLQFMGWDGRLRRLGP